MVINTRIGRLRSSLNQYFYLVFTMSEIGKIFLGDFLHLIWTASQKFALKTFLRSLMNKN